MQYALISGARLSTLAHRLDISLVSSRKGTLAPSVFRCFRLAFCKCRQLKDGTKLSNPIRNNRTTKRSQEITINTLTHPALNHIFSKRRSLYLSGADGSKGSWIAGLRGGCGPSGLCSISPLFTFSLYSTSSKSSFGSLPSVT